MFNDYQTLHEFIRFICNHMGYSESSLTYRVLGNGTRVSIICYDEDGLKGNTIQATPSMADAQHYSTSRQKVYSTTVKRKPVYYWVF